MMTNIAHQVADFDSVVEDELTRKILTDLNLMPSEWGLPENEQRRILCRGLRLQAAPDLEDPNWPAYENLGMVTFSEAAFCSGKLSRDQLLATLLHEVGHRVNPLPYMESMLAELSKVGADQATKPANRDELYADDYVLYCGLGLHLQMALQLLMAIRENFRIQSTRERIARIEADGQPLLLNLTLLPA